MITRMKKLSFLIHSKEYEQFLEQLRALGVVHVVQKQAGAIQDDSLQEDLNLLARYKNALKVLEPLAAQPIVEVPDDHTKGFSFDTPAKVVERYDILEADKVVQEQTLQLLSRDRAQLLPWGDFDPHSLERLADKGYKIRFYTCPIRAFQEDWVSAYGVVEIERDKQKVNFVTVTHPEVVPDIDAEQVNLPAMSLRTVEKDIAKTKAAIDSIPLKMAQLAHVGVDVLKEGIRNLENRISFSQVRLTGEHLADDSLLLLEEIGRASCRERVLRAV